jgi:hypothetical protein
MDCGNEVEYYNQDGREWIETPWMCPIIHLAFPEIPQQLTHVSGKWSTVAIGSFDKQLGGERGMTDEPE